MYPFARSDALLEILGRQAEHRHRLLQIVGEHRRAEQIGRGAIVVGVGGLVAQIPPILEIAVTAAEPCQCDEIDLLIDIQLPDESGKLGEIGFLADRPFAGEMVIFGTFDMPRTFPKPTYQNDISSLAFAKPPATLAVPANGDLREIKNESFVMAGRAAPNPPGLWPIIKKRISDRHQAGGIARGFAKGFAGGHDAYA
jgi:hypothetical protein